MNLDTKTPNQLIKPAFIKNCLQEKRDKRFTTGRLNIIGRNRSILKIWIEFNSIIKINIIVDIILPPASWFNKDKVVKAIALENKWDYKAKDTYIFLYYYYLLFFLLFILNIKVLVLENSHKLLVLANTDFI